ncbi:MULTISPECIES: DUF2950 domain-containing protein [Buttiauxella]|jgi:hypothetical protein|uniref:Exported protein n=1 Tax=Buttiauxella ferragutiae ATCC 51602 TaxID=1354252 RepID=A0ABX2WDX6_9ENTR|nr:MULTISPECIES: DUF2950 domain-containing protein [Buttiauxella]AYN27527.1 DUF2950 domain-containing protein [Buttiauxella sp. 3AFRM03]MCE0826480.1 DUF2950 domain-containing protein [Buttiauxella ferragutiae]OAT33338.1 putative exported protein [Buttiauxella ferragutiae ATCC 51602]TDN48050.1 DUF2950 family protein [Buttiauxella sp. JUb87]UNK60623.1 DUF2950 domain-containing protein [Buttiauxella ferragutiae]
MKNRMKLCALVMLMLPAFVQAQQLFTTPELAATSFADAVISQDEAALTKVLGDNWRQYLPDDKADPEAVARFVRDWKVSHNIEQKGETAHLNVGHENWQLPIPIVKTDAGWHFDMQQAADEILTRTIGLNELSAIQAIDAYVAAQEDYYQLNQQYAQKFVSSEGKKDGLYWPLTPGESPSPLGPSFSPEHPGMGYHGYHFRILTAQGADAAGGEKNYISDGKMAAGFALIAWPVEYGETGITTFMVDNQGVIYQKDLGEQTAEKVKEIKQFNPDKSWEEDQ